MPVRNSSAWSAAKGNSSLANLRHGLFGPVAVPESGGQAVRSVSARVNAFPCAHPIDQLR